jgi:hypothetical protein
MLDGNDELLDEVTLSVGAVSRGWPSAFCFAGTEAALLLLIGVTFGLFSSQIFD